MTDAKTKAAIGITAAATAWGFMTVLAPPASDTDRSPSNLQQQVEELADADEAGKDRMRDEGNDLLDAEEQRRLSPHEPRPHGPRVRLR